MSMLTSNPNNTTANSKLSGSLTWMGLALFWLAVFLLNAGPHWEAYKSNREMIETAGLTTSIQFVIAVVVLKLLLPKFLETNKNLAFAVSLLVLVFALAQIGILIRFYYLEPMYPDSYTTFLKNFGDKTIWQRLNPLWTTRYIIFSKLPLYIFPSVLLTAIHFYKQQRLALLWKEQKKSAELEALRNQLNPHFIFNTLNNIYALSLKKSDQAPLAIEKLSDILDYVVYRCTEQYVLLEKEIKLLENYIGLEKLRYGDRLNVELKVSSDQAARIAPLILLTLLENACKHSTANELGQAQVSLSIDVLEDVIQVRSSNSKAQLSNKNTEQDKVGLENLRKQLALLYPDEHLLNVEESNDSFTIQLALARR